ncbi:MAG TPA: hypothetical protein VHZ95_04645, partial [Polyangiales bacterium]|nr:hypothetical protein [Polyangiales bacterium]
MGIEESCARDQFAALDDDAARLTEVGALVVESDAGLLLPMSMALPAALFELVDGLRQAGLSVSLQTSQSGATTVSFHAPRPLAYELHIGPNATTRDLVRAVANIVPRTHQILLALDYQSDEAVPIVILDRGSYVWFSAALGDGTLERALTRAAGEVENIEIVVCDSGLREADFPARFETHRPDPGASGSVDAAFERVRRYDPRIAWPSTNRRPPGDDFFALCQALAGETLAQVLSDGNDPAWASLLYRFALATLVGAKSDLHAARSNPGQPAQGLLGFGQLTWAWFIFDALGAVSEAAQAAELLEQPWVRNQERGNVSTRQRAYYDLGQYLRTGKRGASLSRLSELLLLSSREAFQNSATLRAAVAVHSEPFGDQLTHHPLYHAWPAPLYSLARRAEALDVLPLDNPFVARPLHISAVDRHDRIVMRLEQQLAMFSALDPARLPALLDPLPVIVDVRITDVDSADARGHTLLCAHDAAEHRVIAPLAGKPIKPGEVWLLEVNASRPSSATVHYDD